MNINSSRNIIILILSAMAVFQAIYLVTYIFEKERNEIKSAVYHKVRNISMSLQNSIEFLMRNNEVDQVKVKITELGVDAEIKHALLLDQDSKVYASTHLTDIGDGLIDLSVPLYGDDVDKLYSDVNKSITSSKGKVWTSKNNELVVSVYPVAAFLSSENVRFKKTGSLIVLHDLKKSVDKTYGLIMRLVMIQIFGLLLFGLLLHFIVFRRMAVIRKGAEKIKDGDYNVTIPLTGNDELGLLARNIEAMATKVNDLLGKVFRNEETFAKAQEIAHIGSWDWDIINGDLVWSDEIYRIFGLAPQQFGATYDEFLKSVHPDDVEGVTSAVNNAVADENISYYVEHRVVHPNGTIRDVQEQGVVYRDVKGDPVRMIGTVLDITERKVIEQALKDERNFINAVLESAGALVVVLDNKGRIIRFNNACENLCGYTFEEIEYKYLWDTVLPNEDAEEIYAKAFDDLIKHPKNVVNFYTNYWVSKDGAYSLVDWTNNLLLDEDGSVEYVVSTGIDITAKQKALDELEDYRDKLEYLVNQRTNELKIAQDELLRKERLATLGQLTATVSHELRNPLGAMTPSLYVINKLSDPNNERVQQAITRIERNVGRCDRIIDELLDFTRIESVSLVLTEVDSWLMSIIEEQSIPDGIKIEKNMTLNNESALIDFDVMRRAVINVYDNACQAMQSQTDGNKVSDNAILSISTEKSNGRFNMIFKDSGCGMSEEVINKIFEPLFSTKGFGVGLGMPTVLQIMQQHKGGVDVVSEVNVGTSVTLWLPVIN
jgi:PAS domain S-box-containing protein